MRMYRILVMALIITGAVSGGCRKSKSKSAASTAASDTVTVALSVNTYGSTATAPTGVALKSGDASVTGTIAVSGALTAVSIGATSATASSAYTYTPAYDNTATHVAVVSDDIEPANEQLLAVTVSLPLAASGPNQTTAQTLKTIGFSSANAATLSASPATTVAFELIGDTALANLTSSSKTAFEALVTKLETLQDADTTAMATGEFEPADYAMAMRFAIKAELINDSTLQTTVAELVAAVSADAVAATADALATTVGTELTAASGSDYATVLSTLFGSSNTVVTKIQTAISAASPSQAVPTAALGFTTSGQTASFMGMISPGPIQYDADGNLYASGEAMGGFDGGTVTGTSDLYLTKYSPKRVLQWTRFVGIASESAFNGGIAIDKDKNVIQVGQIRGSIDGQTYIGGSNSYSDAIVMKYDPSGTRTWTKQFGLSGRSTQASSVLTDSSGNIYVGGNALGALNGETYAGMQSSFLMKLDSSGTVLWTRLAGCSTNGKSTYITGLSFDSAGRITGTGATTCPTLNSQTLTGVSDIVNLTYDTSGTLVSTVLIGEAATTMPALKVTTDIDFNLIYSGSTNLNVFGQTKTGTNDGYVTVFNAAGTRQWAKFFGVASTSASAKAAIADADGNTYVCGGIQGAVGSATYSGAGTDNYLAKLDSSGTLVWARQFGPGVAAKMSTCSGLAIQSNKYITIGGAANASIGSTSLSFWALYFTRYDTDGNAK